MKNKTTGWAKNVALYFCPYLQLLSIGQFSKFFHKILSLAHSAHNLQ